MNLFAFIDLTLGPSSHFVNWPLRNEGREASRGREGKRRQRERIRVKRRGERERERERERENKTKYTDVGRK